MYPNNNCAHKVAEVVLCTVVCHSYDVIHEYFPMNNAVAGSQWLVEYSVVSRMQLFKECYGILTSCMCSSITSLSIYEVAQNKGGDLHYPICRQLGMNTLISSIFLVGVKDGSRDPKFHAYCSFTCRC